MTVSTKDKSAEGMDFTPFQTEHGCNWPIDTTRVSRIFPTSGNAKDFDYG